VDVATWLRGLGLEQYEPAFRDHGIDAQILPKLTACDLLAPVYGWIAEGFGTPVLQDAKVLLDELA
jgi:hypothetical protein